jgi:acetoin utilization deacetylase AcuC-like enzyme
MPTGFAFEAAAGHLYSGHPEHPERFSQLKSMLPSMGGERIEGRAATEDEIGLVHSPTLIHSIQEASSRGEAIIDFAPTYVTRASYGAALGAAGATLECVRGVLERDVRNAFAIVRPPGHHAEPDRAMGFCLFNNAAVGAAFALKRGLERVAIVDFDAHHGNGTQAAFLEKPRVAYLSTHQWGIYPGTGWFEEAPQARSRIVNVPLPSRSGDEVYGRVTESIIRPFIQRFQPQLLLVSAGFDAHWNDPITALGLSSAGFRSLSRALVQAADEMCAGRVVFVLEGGYDPTNVANGAAAVFSALTGSPLADPGDHSPHAEPDVEHQIGTIRQLHGF